MLAHSHSKRYPEIISAPKLIHRGVACLPPKMKTAWGHVSRGWAWRRGSDLLAWILLLETPWALCPALSVTLSR